MRRNWQCLRGPGGSADAQRLAAALAEIADAEFIERVLQGKAALDAFGGELRIGAYRERLDAEGNRTEKDDPTGTYETLAYLFDYNHHNKLTGGPVEPNAKEDVPPPPAELTDLTEPEQSYDPTDADAIPASQFMGEEPVG